VLVQELDSELAVVNKKYSEKKRNVQKKIEKKTETKDQLLCRIRLVLAIKK